MRAKVIQKIIDAIGGRTYLEIGVQYGNTFERIRCQRKFGVDPMPPAEKVRKILNSRTKYFRMTSDEFFAHHAHIFKDDKIDVAFIDGCHSYEQSLRDVNNCLKHLDKKGIIVMHDCNPPDERRSTKSYCGEVWKTILHLRTTRNDLRIFVLDCDFGLGIVTGGRQEHPLSIPVEKIKQMSYKDLNDSRWSLLNLKPCSYLDGFLPRRL
ncbi:MAG: hypothetical protein HPY66_2180 [Firmicutes bacterium]|nr:hypothetical protein [Bacillota bacterium]MDI6707198.1 class I SAM-dependent methyltransferase [Bacillota bacterium]